ncbi:hypothetical protein INT44_000688, partial [Umbelopsis vinacea]
KPQEARVGVGCFVILKGTATTPNRLLIGRRKGSHGAGTYQLPGGHLEFKETFEECAIREVYEETGLTLRTAEFATATNDVMTAENKHYCTMFMKATVDPEDVKNLRSMEPEKLDGDWAWITWNDLAKEDSQYRPLFLPLQNLLLTRPHFTI